MNVPAIAIGGALVGTIIFAFSSKAKQALSIAEGLTYVVADFDIPKIDLQSNNAELHVTLRVTSQHTGQISFSNLQIRISIPDGNNYRQFALSAPTGPLTIQSGINNYPLRFTAPLARELATSINTFMKGKPQTFLVEVFPEILGQKINPIQHQQVVVPKQVLTAFLKDIFNLDNGMGYVPDLKNKIKEYSAQYGKYFDLSKLQGTDPDLPGGDTFDTLREMRKIVKQTLSDTKAIAKHLKRNTVTDTLKAVFTFANDSFNYRLDTPGIEQLRRPARSWKDRREGIDCDCFSILISSILTNLNIKHSFRKAKYNNSPNFSHVYVIAHNKGKDYVLDPVYGKWNSEVQISGKFDKTQL